jgi:hypothetical protein
MDSLPLADESPVTPLLDRAVRRRGYQDSGAETERPSDRSSVSVSLVTNTCLAVADRGSTVEEFMQLFSKRCWFSSMIS